MKRTTSRMGYSLLELMIVVAVFGLIMSSTAYSFIACIRLFNITMSESELALRTRELRDKLLFHAQATAGGTYYAGLLSGTNVTANADGVTMWTEGTRLGRRPGQRISLSVRDAGGARRFANAAETADPDWLVPGGFALVTDAGTPVVQTVTDRGQPVRLYLNLALRHTIAGGTDITHRERVVVPLFQKYQPKWSGEVNP